MGKVIQLERNGKGFLVTEVRLHEIEPLPGLQPVSSLLQTLLAEAQTEPQDGQDVSGWADRDDINSLDDIVNYARQLRGKPPISQR